jgi:predicted extracellular nuclease
MSVCALKFDAAPNHPTKGAAIKLSGVLVTTPTTSVGGNTLSIFIQDQQTNSVLSGRYSGINVQFPSGSVSTPKLGDVINLDGIYQETQLSDGRTARSVTANQIDSTGHGAVSPVLLESADQVATGGPDSDAYEGVLIRFAEVTITQPTVTLDKGPMPGAFRIEGSLIVAPDLYSFQTPALGLQFSALTGVLHLTATGPAASEYTLDPRFASDTVAKNAAAVVTTIRDLQDPSSPGAPAETCHNDSGTQTIGKCANADLHGVIVTGVEGYVSKNLRALWVQDPNSPDGRFAGIKVTYKKASLPYTPTLGDTVHVTGQSILYQGGMQLQFATVTQEAASQDMPVIAPTIVQATDIARRSPDTHTYEGVLVEVQNAIVDQACVEDSKLRDEGNWTLVGDVMMGTDWIYTYIGGFRPSSVQCLDSAGEPTGACDCMAHTRPADERKAGDRFSSITGIVDFAYGDYQLNPRSDSDLVKE